MPLLTILAGLAIYLGAMALLFAPVLALAWCRHAPEPLRDRLDALEIEFECAAEAYIVQLIVVRRDLVVAP